MAAELAVFADVRLVPKPLWRRPADSDLGIGQAHLRLVLREPQYPPRSGQVRLFEVGTGR